MENAWDYLAKANAHLEWHIFFEKAPYSLSKKE